MDASVLSLEKLVAEIDREIGILPSDDRKPVARTYGRKQYIRFLLGDMLMALPLTSALEIGHRPDITPLPNLPDWVLGVSNIRGEIISITDLKLFLGMPSIGVKRDSRFIVVRHRDMKVGMIVDKVMGIISIDQEDVTAQENPYRKTEESGPSAYILGVVIAEDGLLNLLDIDKLMSSTRMNAFRDE